MPSFALDADYPTHPKVLRLMHLLGMNSRFIPIALWCHCCKHHADGRLSKYSTRDIERAVGWTGPAGKCVAALLEVGLLDQVEGGYAVHDWGDWQRRPDAGAEAVTTADSSSISRGGGRGGCLLPLNLSSEIQNQKDKNNTPSKPVKHGAARRVADAYRVRVTGVFGIRGAREVQALLAAGVPEERLLAAVEHAAEWYQREGRAPGKRPACWTFFGSEEWEGFVEGVPPATGRAAKAKGGNGRFSLEELHAEMMK